MTLMEDAQNDKTNDLIKSVAETEKRNWEKQKKFCIDPIKFAKERAKLSPRQEDVCTMCGEFYSTRDE